MAGLNILGVVMMTHCVSADEHPNDPQQRFSICFERFWWAPAGCHWVMLGVQGHDGLPDTNIYGQCVSFSSVPFSLFGMFV